MEKFFKLQEKGTTYQREILAGITTFLTMAYILAVNPGLLSGRSDGLEALIGMPWGGVFTATALAAAIATIVMAFAANLPVALAPGMGLNAFFVYTAVLGMKYSWQVALAAVFLEGILFMALSLFNVREAIIKAIPANMKKAVAVGIGLFIALIGFSNANIIIVSSPLVGLGNLTSGGPLLALIGLIVIIVLYALKIPGHSYRNSCDYNYWHSNGNYSA